MLLTRTSSHYGVPHIASKVVRPLLLPLWSSSPKGEILPPSVPIISVCEQNAPNASPPKGCRITCRAQNAGALSLSARACVRSQRFSPRVRYHTTARRAIQYTQSGVLNRRVRFSAACVHSNKPFSRVFLVSLVQSVENLQSVYKHKRTKWKQENSTKHSINQSSKSQPQELRTGRIGRGEPKLKGLVVGKNV